MAAASKSSKYERSVIETKALRPYVPTELRALFDHLLELAAHSHKSGYAKRGGRELLHARKLARPPEDYAPPKPAKEPKRARISDRESVMLAIAEVDWNDDRDGAEYFEQKDKVAVRKLAKAGYLRILSDDKKVVRALLTDKGVQIRQERNAPRAAVAEQE